MKGPLAQLLLWTVVCGFGLWPLVKWFVDDNDDPVSTLPLSPAANLRTDAPARSKAPIEPDTNGDVIEDPESSISGRVNGSVSLGADELNARAAARRQRLADLGIIPAKQPEPTIAVDVSLEMPEQCTDHEVARVPIGVKFRFESSIIKGESLNALESLVAFHRACESGRFIVVQNPLGRVDATESLTQMRFDEIKYFFIQHSVSIDAVQFSEE